MCVIFFYVNSKPAIGGYKLILASNRDEFFARPTRCAAKWANAEHVYGGIDLEPGREGGTWLAIGGDSNVFKVGALLNLTGEPKPRNAVENKIVNDTNTNYILNNHNNNTPVNISTTSTTTSSPIPDNNSLLGRGMIVSDFVTSTDECTSDAYNRALVADGAKYSAFNFVSIEIGTSNKPTSITLCSNCPARLQHYDEGACYGFGNSPPITPFEKVQHGQKRFEAIVKNFHQKQNETTTVKNPDEAKRELISNLQALLKCQQKFWPDAELQRRAPNWGEHMSSINVHVPNKAYGSRTHTVILIDANDRMHFIEETMTGTDPTEEWLQTHIEKQYFQHN